MARISIEDRLAELDYDGYQPPRRQRRRRHYGSRGWKFKLKAGCCLIFFGLLVFFSIMVLAVVAKTGLVNIPIISDLFYKQPAVVRPVSPASVEQSDIESKIGSLLVNRTVEFTEEELTFMFRQVITGSEDSYFAPGVQVAVENGQLEFFGLLTKPFTANITLHLRPYLEAGQLKFELTQAQLGSLAMPPDTANWLFSEVFGSKLEEVSSEIEKLNPQSLELESGKIILQL